MLTNYHAKYYAHDLLRSSTEDGIEKISRSLFDAAEEVAEYLRIHQYTVRRLARAGKLPGFKIGGQWRFDQQELERLKKWKKK